MGPHSEHLHRLGFVEDLVDQAVLNAYAPRVSAGQVAHELLERGRRLVGVLCEDRQQGLSLWLQAGRSQLLRVLLSLLRVDESPAHQRSSPSSSSAGVAMPSMMDSRMPGMDTRYRVSCTARQSSSPTRTALPRLPVIWTGSCESDTSSRSL